MLDALNQMQKMQLLMGLGARLMQAGGQGQNWGQGLGGSMLGTLQDLNQIQQSAATNRIRQLQTDELLRKAEMEQKRQAAGERASALITGKERGLYETPISSNVQGDAYMPSASFNPGVPPQPMGEGLARQLMALGAETGNQQVMGLGGNIYKDLLAQQGSTKPYYTPVTTSEGIYTFNTRTGKVKPATGTAGKVLTAPTADVLLQRNLAGAKAAGKAVGEAQTQAQLELPEVRDKAAYMIDLVTRLRDHPGMEMAVGKSSIFPMSKIPGTDAANFEAIRQQIKGATFLQAYQDLKGGGQITEAEGQKAENAIARLQTSQSEEEFKNAANELIGVVQKGRARQEAKASGLKATIPEGQPQLPSVNPFEGMSDDEFLKARPH